MHSSCCRPRREFLVLPEYPCCKPTRGILSASGRKQSRNFVTLQVTFRLYASGSCKSACHCTASGDVMGAGSDDSSGLPSELPPPSLFLSSSSCQVTVRLYALGSCCFSCSEAFSDHSSTIVLSFRPHFLPKLSFARAMACLGGSCSLASCSARRLARLQRPM